MPKMTVPEKYKPGVARIQQLSEAEIGKLQDAVRKSVGGGAPFIRSSALIPQIAAEGTAAKELGETIAALYRVRSSQDVTLEQFADDICEAMGVNGEDRVRLKKNITSLLGIEEIGLASKAWDLQTEDERTFCDARILTDLRPIFGTNIQEGPKGMVLVHILKIGFHDAGTGERHKDFYISLDADDLTTLRNVIDRAGQKAESLKTSIANFKYLGRS